MLSCDHDPAPQTRALRYHATGKFEEVLRLETIPSVKPGEGEVLARLETAVVHPSDLGQIAGTYGRLRTLPAVAGREGVGRVVAVGAGVSALKPGDRVRMPEDEGVWRDAVVARADALLPVPADIPDDQAAMAFINPPTAWLLLRKFVALNPGDWVIQNAANSAVGECVIQLAHAAGLRTINLVRSPEKHEARLKNLGADIVLPDDKEAVKAVAAHLAGASPRLALNSVGGMSVATLIRTLGRDGVLVTFGGMTGDPIRFPTREFIFSNITCRGFWMDRWARSASREERDDVFGQIFENLRRGTLRMEVDSIWPLEKYAEALARAAAYGRNGKVLLRP
ncbi:MAG: 2-enoyl thioester reductase domain-containing protein [Puniceicoccales bacterium]|nr:2-enoyl thioester reductase domain-containing protein [Puniceicoccales bacterium]